MYCSLIIGTSLSQIGQDLLVFKCLTMQLLQNECKHSMIVVASTKYPLQITHVNCVLISSNRKSRFRLDKSSVDDDVVLGENDDVDVGDDSVDDGNLICNLVSEDDDDEH